MKTPPKALGVKTRTEPSHSWLSGLLLPGQTADPAGRTTSRSATTRSRASAKKCTSCARASNGKIARSPAARRSFQASHPCPATGKTYGACKGYVIDHVVPLKRGGADSPGNMQWQSLSSARAKDRIE